MPCLDGDSQPIPQGPAVPRPLLSLRDQTSTKRPVVDPETTRASKWIIPLWILPSKSAKLKSQVSLPSKVMEEQAVWKLMAHWWRAVFRAAFWSPDGAENSLSDASKEWFQNSPPRSGKIQQRCVHRVLLNYVRKKNRARNVYHLPA